MNTKTPRPLTTPPESPRNQLTPDTLKETIKISVPYDNEPAPVLTLKEKAKGVHFGNTDDHSSDNNSTESSESIKSNGKSSDTATTN